MTGSWATAARRSTGSGPTSAGTCPGARSLLELGCGTGALLARAWHGDLDVTGIDQSPQMLAIAHQAVPGARLVRGDMTAFTLPARFDVVICMFDTLNHVPSFDGWLSLFSCVHEHLAEGGLFIFDVNTAGLLRGLDGAPPFLDEFDGNVVIMTVRSAHDGLSLWETRIFDRQRRRHLPAASRADLRARRPACADPRRAGRPVRAAGGGEPGRQPGQRRVRPGVLRLPAPALRPPP